MASLLETELLYCGSDGSHVFGFTSSKKIGPMWGGAALTPGNSSEMSSLWTDRTRGSTGHLAGSLCFSNSTGTGGDEGIGGITMAG